MIERINKMLDEREAPDGWVIPCGWWELEDIGLMLGDVLMQSRLMEYDAVVIVGRDRIAKRFHSFLHMIEDAFICS
jgi:hypothetical protein